MENSTNVTVVKAAAVQENKGLSLDKISGHLNRIRESQEKLEIIQAKADNLEKKLDERL